VPFAISELQDEERAITEVTLEILSELATRNDVSKNCSTENDELKDRILMPPPKMTPSLDMAGLGLKDTIQVRKLK
jgi:hypothetical protein